MAFYLLFNSVLCALVIFLLAFSGKVYMDTKKDASIATKRIKNLNNFLKIERLKDKQVSQQIVLTNRLHDALFKRLFKITKELLLLQKLIFDKQS